jgi:hypothetical protein
MIKGMMKNVGILMSGCFNFFCFVDVELYVVWGGLVMVSHEKIPFKLGAPKEFWDS